ncbi:hypothetical protein [Bradyrhizobium septentrionale]|uniref:Integrase catalytic domain-containing protein n=1 Tax=Bradyrhizobium septentrionale TaxID=1404411 RepID=A0ABZ2NVT3_9BRAD
MHDEALELQHLQASNVTPIHSDKGRENADAMAAFVSILNHRRALRMEPRLRVTRKADIDNRWYACQTSLEILKTKVLRLGHGALAFCELILGQ